MTELFSLAGKRAVVTGASRGLGRAMAEALAAAGADVACVSTSAKGTDDTAAAVRKYGREVWQFAANLGTTEEAERLPENVMSETGAIDILVNNAGTIIRHNASEYPLRDWNTVIQTNLNSVFVLCQRFGERMIERRQGKIINIASLLSFSGGIRVPAYTASKHAVAGLTKALANEWAQYNVQVNAIAPGYFKTDNTDALQKDEKRFAEISARIPAGSWGEPGDLAGPVVFLASSASNYVNGHILVVDGGWMAR